MRLPQSILQSFSVRPIRFLALGLAISLLGMAAVSASASTPQLACTPSGLRFGDTIVGQSETLLVTLANNGQTSVTVSEVTASNSEFSMPNLSLPLVLAAGQSVELSVSFTAQELGWTGGTIKSSSNAAGASLLLQVAGTGVSSETLTASPAVASFGQVAVGARSTLPVVLTNARSWRVTVSALQITGSGFSMTGPALPLTLSAGQSISLTVTFAPSAAGAAGGSLFVVGPTLNIPLTGTGTGAGQLIIAPAPLNFGDVTVGATTTQAMTLSATGANVTVSSASNSSSQFALDGASFPLTIAVGQSMSFNVGFTPQKSGTVSGSLTFVSNASNPLAVESLSGTGTAAQYSVNLFWNSSLSEVAGYNVYRSATATGTYSKINSALDPSTAYTDTTVVAGQTYYYEATSVTSSGQESAKSTPPVEAVVP